MVSLVEDNLVVFYKFSKIEIWSDKRVVPGWEWPYKRVLMVYDDNATLNNISVILWHSVLLMEETELA